MQYLFPKMIFGSGRRSMLASEARCYGKRAVLFHSASLAANGMLDEFLSRLRAEKLDVHPYCLSCGEEPTDRTADEAARFTAECGAEFVIAVGGGAVMDIGKIAAALAVNKGCAADYAEGVGGKQIAQLPLPFIALPTTSGTGSEMTKNGVICLDGYGKRSIRSDNMLAKCAIIDPELTLSVPAELTAASGADALCQLIESYTSLGAAPLTDGLALAHIRPTAEALRRAVFDGSDLSARETLSAGASVSGICLANAGLGLVHGIAGALGGLCGIRHGICCGILLPHVIAANKGTEKYMTIAEDFGFFAKNEDSAGAFLAEKIFRLNEDIGIPYDLRSFSIPSEKLETIAEISAKAGGTKKNPVAFSADEIRIFLEKLI